MVEGIPEEDLAVPEKAIIHLYNSVERLNYSITKLLNLFETAKIDQDQNQSTKMILRIKDISSQNEKIAKGILSLANIIKEEVAAQPDYQSIIAKLDRLEMLMQTNPQNNDDYKNLLGRMDKFEEHLKERPEPAIISAPVTISTARVEEQPLQKIPLKRPIQKLNFRRPTFRPEPKAEDQRSTFRPEPKAEESSDSFEFLKPEEIMPNRRMDASVPPAFRAFEEPPKEPVEMPQEDVGEFKFSEESAQIMTTEDLPKSMPDMLNTALEGIDDMDVPRPPPQQKSFLSKLKR